MPSYFYNVLMVTLVCLDDHYGTMEGGRDPYEASPTECKEGEKEEKEKEKRLRDNSFSFFFPRPWQCLGEEERLRE